MLSDRAHIPRLRRAVLHPNLVLSREGTESVEAKNGAMDVDETPANGEEVHECRVVLSVS